MNRYETVYRFAAWLTQQEEPVTLSSKHNAAPAAELAERFCEENHLEDDEAEPEG